MEIQYIFGNPRKARPKKNLARKKKSSKNNKSAKKSTKKLGKSVLAKNSKMKKYSKKSIKKSSKKSLKKKRNPFQDTYIGKNMIVGAKGIKKKPIIGRSGKMLTEKEFDAVVGKRKKLVEDFKKAQGDSKKRQALSKKVSELTRTLKKHEDNALKAAKFMKENESRIAKVKTTSTKLDYKKLLEGDDSMAKKKKARKKKSKKVKAKKVKAKKAKSKKAKKTKVRRKKAKKVLKLKVKKSRKKSRKKTKKKRTTKAHAKLMRNKQVQYKLTTLEPAKKKKKVKKLKYKVRGKKRTGLLSFKRLNPFGGNMKVKLKEFTGLDAKEAGYLALGSVSSDLVEKLARKYLGAYVGQLDAMVPGGVKAVNALVVGAAAAAAHKYVKNDHAKEVAKAVIVAQIVKLASSMTDMVAKPLGLAGVDYTPLSGIPYGMRGVDYTPLSGVTPQMAGVNFTKSLAGTTPQMAGMGYGADFGRGYDVSDYGGGGGYTEDRKFSAADFGSHSDDEPTLDQSGSMS